MLYRDSDEKTFDLALFRLKADLSRILLEFIVGFVFKAYLAF